MYVSIVVVVVVDPVAIDPTSVLKTRVYTNLRRRTVDIYTNSWSKGIGNVVERVNVLR